MMIVYKAVSARPEKTKAMLSPRLTSIFFSFRIIQHSNVTNILSELPNCESDNRATF
jgi:hypothetical protein